MHVPELQFTHCLNMEIHVQLPCTFVCVPH